MKKLIIFLLIVATFGSCTKKEVDPKVLAEAVTGTYDLTYLKVIAGADVTTFPELPTTQSGLTVSATASLTPSSTSTDKIDIQIALKVQGKTPNTVDLKGYEIRKKGDDYALYVGSTLAAELDGKNINFDYSQTQSGGVVGFKFDAKR